MLSDTDRALGLLNLFVTEKDDFLREQAAAALKVGVDRGDLAMAVEISIDEVDLWLSGTPRRALPQQSETFRRALEDPGVREYLGLGS